MSGTVSYMRKALGGSSGGGWMGLLPGLGIAAAITVVAYLLAEVPGLGVIGALGIALFIGIAVRAVVGLPDSAHAGTNFAAKVLLRVGVVLLGVRLNFALIGEAGVAVLLLDALVIVSGVIFIERVGKWLGMGLSLRLAVAIGSSICGASAIAASSQVVKASDDEVSVSVGVVSILGTFGVLAYAVLGGALGLGETVYGLLAGSTLQEVGQALAAGFAHSPGAGDLATVTKLARVAMLAPVLIIVGAVLARKARDEDGGGGDHRGIGGITTLIPPFLVGFLVVGVANTIGFIPTGIAGSMQTASIMLTAAAMAGIGLGVHLGVLRDIGGKAVLLGVIGFAFITTVAVSFVTLARAMGWA